MFFPSPWTGREEGRERGRGEGSTIQKGSFSWRSKSGIQSSTSCSTSCVPEGLDWERLVVTYPIPALLIAAIGGFLIGRSHGPQVLGAVSTFASAELARNVSHLMSQDG